MLNDVKFVDNRVAVKSALDAAVLAFLEEAGGTVAAQAAKNSRVDTGQTKGSFRHVVREPAGQAVVGSQLENAVWEELGTGEYALGGNGRKGGWAYKDNSGKWHFTKGKKPSRALWNAFESLKGPITKRAGEILKERMK